MEKWKMFDFSSCRYRCKPFKSRCDWSIHALLCGTSPVQGGSCPSPPEQCPLTLIWDLLDHKSDIVFILQTFFVEKYKKQKILNQKRSYLEKGIELRAHINFFMVPMVPRFRSNNKFPVTRMSQLLFFAEKYMKHKIFKPKTFISWKRNRVESSY